MFKKIVITSCMLFALSLFGQIGFYEPESVVFDSASQSYLVSNKGNGQIIRRSINGDLELFCQHDTSVRGVSILDNYLYACGDQGVSQISLSDGSLIQRFTFTGMSFLNDITAKGHDTLYVTDNGRNRIYGIDLINNSTFTLIETITAPNGIVYDQQNNRLIVCSWSGKWIKAVTLNNLEITTLVTTAFSYLDGLVKDKSGNYYVSSWQTNSVYKYADFIQPAIMIQSGFNGPADIYYHESANLIVVPNFNSNSLDFVDLTVGIEENEELGIRNEELTNYPNPFNPATTIKYQLAVDNVTKLTVYNTKGEMVQTLVNARQTAGNYKVTFEGSKLNSGIYFYKLESGNSSQINKMILCK